MADRKISDLTALTAPASGDYLPIVDISEAAAANKNKRITIEELFRGVPLGTAAAPSIAIEGDENTGIYSPGADQLAISTGGTGRLFVDANGVITIGASSTGFYISPLTGSSAYLATDSASTAADFVFGTSTSIPIRFIASNTERLRITSTGQLSHIGAGSSSTPAVSFSGSAPVNSLVVDSSGRCGVGTSSVSRQLTVTGTTVPLRLETSDSSMAIEFVSNAGTRRNWLIGAQYNVNGGFEITPGTANGNTTFSTPAFVIDSSSRVGIGTSSFTPRFAVNNSVNGGGYGDPNSYYAAAENTGVYGLTTINSGSLTASKAQAGVIGVGRVNAGGAPGSGNEVYGVLGVVSNGYGGGINAFGIGCIGDGYISGRLGIGTTAPGDYYPGNLVVAGGNQAGLSIVTGTTQLGMIAFADGNTGADRYRGSIQYDHSNDSFQFATNAGSAALVIDSSKRLLVGASSTSTSTNTKLVIQQNNAPKSGGSPEAALFLTTGSTGEYALQMGAYNSGSLSTSYTWISSVRSNDSYYDPAAIPPLSFRIADQEAVRIDAYKRLLVGTSTAWDASTDSVLQLVATGASNPKTLTFGRNSNSADAVLGNIEFYSASNVAARISAANDLAHGAGDGPGRLVFSTTEDGASSPTERMRITNGGLIDIGGLYSVGANAIRFDVQGSNFSRNTTSSATQIVFVNPNGTVGTITTSGSATAYNTSSDYRLKENVTPVTDGITRLQQLKPSRFNFIADPAKTVDGFLAHEAQAVVPECVTGEKDAVDDDGNPIYQGIDQSKLVPLLTAALQEAVAKIESLEARLTAAGI